MRIIFMGTPDFSVPTLESLLKSKHEIVGVFCQPDRPKGRGHKIQYAPVKEMALAKGVPIFQPETFHDTQLKETMAALKADIVIVIAYGKILPPWVLSLTPYGCINLHGSILPKYRGAAPIQWSILNGDSETGITIMQMNEGMDRGDILYYLRTEIKEGETSGELFNRLALLGGLHIEEILEKLENNELFPIKQDDSKASYTKKITKAMGNIDWQKSSKEIYCHIKGFSPWPGAYTFYKGKRIRIWQATVIKEESVDALKEEAGKILSIEKDAFIVSTGKGRIAVREVQLDNKKRMSVNDFLKGFTIEQGVIFTSN